MFDFIVFDSAVYDSTLFDSSVYDSALFDSTVFDSAVFDSTVFDSAVFASSVFDFTAFLQQNVLYGSVSMAFLPLSSHWLSNTYNPYIRDFPSQALFAAFLRHKI